MLRTIGKNYPKVLPKDMNVTVPDFPFLTEIEKNFDVDRGLGFIAQTFDLVVLCVVVYLVLIYSGRRYMKDRPRYNFTTQLFVWNLFLAVSSAVGMTRGLFELGYVLKEFGFKHAVCEMALPEHYNAMGFWGVLFVMSKLLELGDTAFIVLRKQPLIFLHWYHHITVLLIAWYTAPEINTTSRWFAALNGTVHFFMYLHFALRTIKVYIPRWVTMLLTGIQTMQMVVGLLINMAAAHFIRQGHYCHVSMSSIYLSAAIGFSYLLLFSHYFYDSYITNTPMLRNIKLHREKEE